MTKRVGLRLYSSLSATSAKARGNVDSLPRRRGPTLKTRRDQDCFTDDAFLTASE
jgi:hypothetical protein